MQHHDKRSSWERRIKDHLEDYRAEVPHDLWAKIETGMQLRPVKTAKRRSRLALILLAAAVFSGLLFLGGYYFFRQQTAGNAIMDGQLATVSSPEKQKSSNQMAQPGAETAKDGNGKGRTGFLKSGSLSSHAADQTVSSQKGATDLLASNDEILGESDEKQSPNQFGLSADTDGKTNVKAAEAPESPEKMSKAGDKLLAKGGGKERERRADDAGNVFNHAGLALSEGSSGASKLSFNLCSSNGLVQFNTTSTVQMSDRMFLFASLDNGNVIARGNAYSPMPLENYKEETKHYRPMTFGFRVNYGINDRLSVSSGLTYTYLKSDFIKHIPDNDIVRKQALHYIGLPINFNYRFWQAGNLKTYLVVGGEADCNVAAGSSQNGVKVDIGKDDLQWSVNGGLGLQYNITPHFGIYLEPGLRYYLDNHTSVENVFKDKPWQFDLQFGLRYQIHSAADK